MPTKKKARKKRTSPVKASPVKAKAAPKTKAKAEKERPKIDHSKIPRDDPNVLLDHLQAVLGGEGVVIQRGNEVEGRLDLRRPSGIASLDIACGGGLPAGGLSQIDGPEGVGKNLLLNQYYAMNQVIHGENSNIFMLCLEFNYDKMFGRACGVKVGLSPYEIDSIQRKYHQEGKPQLTIPEEVELSKGVGNFHIFRGAAAERLLDGVVSSVALNSYQIGGIDSWDAMLTVADEEKDLEDSPKVADASNVQSRWMKKVQSALTPQKICPECFSRPLGFTSRENSYNYNYDCPNPKCEWKGKHPYMWENETSLIGIRQVRSNLNRRSMKQREYKVGGAWALKHGKLIDIQLRPGEYTLDKTTREKISKEIVWEITKGKAGTHEGKKGAYKYYYTPPEIDTASDIVNYCTHRGLIKYEKRKWVLPHYGLIPNEDPILIFSSKELFMRAVEESRPMQEGLKSLMLRCADLGHVRYK